MDRASLFSLVLAETHRADQAPALPDFLQLAEAKIARELRCEEMADTATLDTSSGAASLPSDYLGVRQVYDALGPLQQVGLMEYRTSVRNRRVYTIANRQLLARVPEVNLLYFARPAAMLADADTNDVLAAHPDLYVSLVSFYLYRRTQDLELAATAEAAYNDARDTLNELADQQRGAARLGKPYSFGNGSSF